MTKKKRSEQAGCPNHGQRIFVVGGLDGLGRKMSETGIAYCYDCNEPLSIRVFSVTINSYENGVYVSRRVGDVRDPHDGQVTK